MFLEVQRFAGQNGLGAERVRYSSPRREKIEHLDCFEDDVNRQNLGDTFERVVNVELLDTIL